MQKGKATGNRASPIQDRAMPYLARGAPLAFAAVMLAHGAAAQPLPLGDGRIADRPQIGAVFSCQTRFSGGGAFRDGPWIQGRVWDPAAKPVVGGAVAW